MGKSFAVRHEKSMTNTNNDMSYLARYFYAPRRLSKHNYDAKTRP